ncbi:uncharacterized protein JN550_010039 [Neoarthrinium moseri]|uniref:uncharacterized protein n=1 Tax=Neoarthrinium moseri TaxID=1658444 RepID=UPI001FDE1313|nr:uncharacterized protein JN550_010039 [Neoarthrinium moseri]KAI1862702.1 hypothetical protein JN550_010039 [Neoarthrinium moseri]
MPVNVPEISHRGYGKQDFERFDNLGVKHASIATSSIGKVKVNCKFLFAKSQWGVLSEDENPAGVIYLDLSFIQPDDCRLKSAVVTVSLDEEHDGLRALSSSEQPKPSIPVQISSYGPQQFQGQAKRAIRTDRISLKPEVTAMGFGGGGIGPESEKTSIEEGMWQFSSQLLPNEKNKKNHWAYQVLRWELTENHLARSSDHSNTIHTAFSFEHDGQPFFMQVEVSGRLESRKANLKRSLKEVKGKLVFPADPRNAPSATTLINFGGRDRFLKPLDELSRDLPYAMEMENLDSVPTRIPTSQRPVFHGGETSGRQEDYSITFPNTNTQGYGEVPTASERYSSHLEYVPNRAPLLQQPKMPGQFLEGDVTPVNDRMNNNQPSTLHSSRDGSNVGHKTQIHDRTEPTTDNLAYFAFNSISPPPTRSARIRPTARSTRASRYRKAEPVGGDKTMPVRRDLSANLSAFLRNEDTEVSEISSVTVVDHSQVGSTGQSDGAWPKRSEGDSEPESLLIFLISWLLKQIPGLLLVFSSSWGVNLAHFVGNSAPGMPLNRELKNTQDYGLDNPTHHQK